MEAEDEDSALDYSQAEGPDSVSRVGAAGAEGGVGRIPASKRSSDAASTQGSGSEGSSHLRVPPAPMPFAQAPLQQGRPRLPPQRRRLGGSDEVSPMGAVTFRMPGGGDSSGAASGFPTPSERDMRAIDGFFAHATNYFPVSAGGRTRACRRRLVAGPPSPSILHPPVFAREQVVGADELYAILAAWAAGESWWQSSGGEQRGCRWCCFNPCCPHHSRRPLGVRPPPCDARPLVVRTPGRALLQRSLHGRPGRQ